MLGKIRLAMGTFVLVATVTGLAAPVSARDTVLQIPLADVLAMPEARGQLDGTVQFFLAGQTTPKLAEKLGDDPSKIILQDIIQPQPEPKQQGTDPSLNGANNMVRGMQGGDMMGGQAALQNQMLG